MAPASKAGVHVAKAPSLRELHRSMVTIRVGPENCPFVMHKERLCHSSSYFKAALTGGFKEAAKKVVKLPDQEVKIFEIVEHWLYTQKLHQDAIDAIEDPCHWRSDLFKVYVFSDRFGMPLLGNAVVDGIVDIDTIAKFMADSTDISYLYENTLPESPVRRLMVAKYALEVCPSYLREHVESYPKDFMVEIAFFHMEKRGGRHSEERAPYTEDICQYHEHSNSNEVCPAKQNKAKKRKICHCA